MYVGHLGTVYDLHFFEFPKARMVSLGEDLMLRCWDSTSGEMCGVLSRSSIGTTPNPRKFSVSERYQFAFVPDGTGAAVVSLETSEILRKVEHVHRGRTTLALWNDKHNEGITYCPETLGGVVWDLTMSFNTQHKVE
eukprot:Trichotokara_eunicae@DN2249_c0_g1_i1.p1